MSADFRCTTDGAFVVLRSLNSAGDTWMFQNLGTNGMKPRYIPAADAPAILESLANAGFTLTE